MNMAEDAEMDRNTPHKQNRPIPSGVITEEEARAISWIASGVALWRAFLVNSTFGTMMMFALFMGIFYNLDPIRAKERIISIPWQAVSRGLLSMPAVWAAYGDITDPLPWVIGVFMFFYVLGFQNSADIIDQDVDSEYGIRTFVVVFGVRKTVIIAAGCTAMMVATVAAAISVGAMEQRFVWLLAIIPFCAYMLMEMWVNPHRISEKTGNHPAWSWFYLGMVLTVAIPLVVEVLF
jgi:4-hydroxybenzoate polyprenyltransferase